MYGSFKKRCALLAGRWSDNGFLMSEPSTELIFYQDTSSHHHVPPDQLLLNSATTATHAETAFKVVAV